MVRRQIPDYKDFTLYVQEHSDIRDTMTRTVIRNRGTIPLPITFGELYYGCLGGAADLLRLQEADAWWVANFRSLLNLDQRRVEFVVWPSLQKATAETKIFFEAFAPENIPRSNYAALQVSGNHPHYEAVRDWAVRVAETENKIDIAVDSIRDVFQTAERYNLTHEEFALMWPTYGKFRGCKPSKNPPRFNTTITKRFSHKGFQYVDELLTLGALLPEMSPEHSREPWVVVS